MMLFKLIGIALIGIVAVSLLRTAKPEFAVFAVIGTGVVMVITLGQFPPKRDTRL